jgi:hypothetical protein
MWEDFVIRDRLSADERESVTVAKENGFDQLVVWCAGPAHAFRVRRNGIPPEPVRFERWRHGVLVERVVRLRNQSDQDEIDDGIDDYLRDAGCGPIPRGFDWYIVVPESIRPPSQLWDHIDIALRDHGLRSGHPRDMRSALEVIVPRLLGRPPAHRSS